MIGTTYSINNNCTKSCCPRLSCLTEKGLGKEKEKGKEERIGGGKEVEKEKDGFQISRYYPFFITF